MQFRVSSYLGHHGSELDPGGEEEGDEEDVVGGEGGAPLPQGPQVEEHRTQRRHQDQDEEDRPLVAAAKGKQYFSYYRSNDLAMNG